MIESAKKSEGFDNTGGAVIGITDNRYFFFTTWTHHCSNRFIVNFKSDPILKLAIVYLLKRSHSFFNPLVEYVGPKDFSYGEFPCLIIEVNGCYT